MDEEELESRAGKAPVRNLEEMSIEALEGYIAELKGEIERVRQAIALKVDARTGADTFFKK